MPAPIQVETPWMRIDLHGHAILRTGAEHLLDIDVVTRPPQQLSSRHVTDNGRVRVRDGSKKTVGLRLPVELESTMDARHDEIKAFEHLVRVVERSICEDIGFDPLQDPEVVTE